MENIEFKRMAWQRLWEGKWFWRLFCGGCLLTLCGSLMNTGVSNILHALNVSDWQAYAVALAKNQKDLVTPVPNLTNDYIFQATSATMLEIFLAYIMAGIAAFGSAVILRKCLVNEENGWLGEAFGGFKAPFGMLWLFFWRQLINLGWGCIAVLPVAGVLGVYAAFFSKDGASLGIMNMIMLSAAFSIACGLSIVIMCVPFYRYRFLWLVKAEHPDWTAGECLRTCRSIMKGNMMRSVRLDCSYWLPITVVLVAAAGCIASVIAIDCGIAVAASAIVCFLMAVAAVIVCIVVGQYISVGQGFLYRELNR